MIGANLDSLVPQVRQHRLGDAMEAAVDDGADVAHTAAPRVAEQPQHGQGDSVVARQKVEHRHPRLGLPDDVGAGLHGLAIVVEDANDVRRSGRGEEQEKKGNRRDSSHRAPAIAVSRPRVLPRDLSCCFHFRRYGFFFAFTHLSQEPNFVTIASHPARKQVSSQSCQILAVRRWRSRGSPPGCDPCLSLSTRNGGGL